jgi:hypothetical protein
MGYAGSDSVPIPVRHKPKTASVPPALGPFLAKKTRRLVLALMPANAAGPFVELDMHAGRRAREEAAN